MQHFFTIVLMSAQHDEKYGNKFQVFKLLGRHLAWRPLDLWKNLLKKKCLALRFEKKVFSPKILFFEDFGYFGL